MDLKSVKQLADLMDERGLTSIEVCEGEHKIALSRQAGAGVAVAPPQPAPAAEAAVPAAEAKAGEALASPLVGVVYLQPKPGAAPFVQAGQKVAKGQVLCIVEAMKVMNDFCAPRDGVIGEVCVEDGQLVEFGAPLFRLL